MKSILTILALALCQLALGQVTMKFGYNSSQFGKLDNSLNFNINDTIRVTGYACAIGPRSGNEILAFNRAYTMREAILALGAYDETPIVISIVLCDVRGASCWKATATQDNSFSSFSSTYRDNVGVDVPTPTSDTVLSNANQSVDSSIVSTTSTSTNTNPLGSDMCNPTIDSSYLHDAMGQDDADEVIVEKKTNDCKCGHENIVDAVMAERHWRQINTNASRGVYKSEESKICAEWCYLQAKEHAKKLKQQKKSKSKKPKKNFTPPRKKVGEIIKTGYMNALVWTGLSCLLY